MRVRQDSRLFLATTAALLAACTSDKSEENVIESCDEPVAQAGVDQGSILGSAVVLDGSASTICTPYEGEGELTYSWAFDQVPTDSAIDESALSDNRSTTASAPSFSPDVDGYYVLSLVVTDPDGQESLPDLVVVTVTVGDAPPVADCGGDVSGLVDEASSMDGSSSYDPEGAQLEYAWTLTQVPDCSELESDAIYNSAGASPTVVPDCAGIYIVGLVVSDGEQWSDYDFCTIDASGVNKAPISDAGESENLGACADQPLQLDGWGSYDPEGAELTYEWTLVEVPSGSSATDASFKDATVADAYFVWDEPGDYTFQLQVFDGELWSAPDIVTLTIDDDTGNSTPIANAGDDQSIESEADCTSSSYVWACEDCPAEEVEFDGSASSDPDGDNLVYGWSEATGTVTFDNSRAALTNGSISAQAAEYGVDNTLSLSVDFEVSDCIGSDTDTMTISYTCTGVAAE